MKIPAAESIKIIRFFIRDSPCTSRAPRDRPKFRKTLREAEQDERLAPGKPPPYATALPRVWYAKLGDKIQASIRPQVRQKPRRPLRPTSCDYPLSYQPLRSIQKSETPDQPFFIPDPSP